jgi:hypothetical protein
MRNSPLLDNGSVRTFPWQRIDTVTDELFNMVIYIQFASKLQKKVPVQSRDSPAPFKKSREAPIHQRVHQKVQERVPDETKKTRLLFMCYRLVK